MLKTLSYCLAKFDHEYYPAIYLGSQGMCHLVYMRHLDKLLHLDEVKEGNIECILKEEFCGVEYDLMESPAYFMVGTTRCFKLGNHPVTMDGEPMVLSGQMVDKITATLLI